MEPVQISLFMEHLEKSILYLLMFGEERKLIENLVHMLDVYFLETKRNCLMKVMVVTDSKT